MRAGKVVRIRVSPQDCMSIVDLLEQADLPLHRIGINNAVSIALSRLLKEKRMTDQLPNRLGFEYMNMMGRLSVGGFTKEKRSIADELYNQAMKGDEERVTPIGGKWVDDMYLPPEYASWEGMTKIAWQSTQQALIDARAEVLMTAEGWSPPAPLGQK